MSAAPPQTIAPLPRLLALAIDALWILGVALPWIWWCSGDSGRGTTWMLAGLWLLSLLVVPCWLTLRGSPGQLLLDQEMVDDRGSPRLLWRQALLRWLLGWLTLASLFYAPLWHRLGRDASAWHERFSGTRLVERDPDLRASVPYRHWVGDLPLAQSVWVHLLAWPLPLLSALWALQAAAPLHTLTLRGGALLQLLGWPLLLALLCWGAVGSWRAAVRMPRRGRMRLPPVVRRLGTRALVVAVVAAGLGLVAVNALPQLSQWLSLLVNRDPLGLPVVSVSADGRRLHVKGALGLGSAAQVRQALASAPHLRWVLLESSVGRLPEAQQVGKLLRARALQTRISTECSGACVYAFLAGTRRQVLPGARLGLQRLSAGVFNPLYQPLLNRSFGAQLAALGLSAHLVRKTLATPHSSLWVPQPDELAASGLVSVPERPLDVELPDPQGAVLADYAEALGASLLWQALEQRYPGLRGIAAEHMAAASVHGAEAVQAAGQQVVSAVLPPLLAQASPETRWLFAELLLQQMTALADDPALCRELLLGDVVAQRRLPRELAWREAQWLLGALAEAPRAAPPRAPRPLELEVIRRTLGLRAPQYLAGLWRPLGTHAPGEPDCARGRAMLTELSTLAAPQRRLALRLLFERGQQP